MKAAVQRLIAKHPGVRIAMGYHNLATAEEGFLEPDAVFHAASTMKVGVMVEIYRRAAAGLLDLDGSILVGNRFASLVDGSEFSVGKEDDSDPELYDHIGCSVSIRELVRRMIVRSSNLATNELLHVIPAADADAFMSELGAPGLRILRGVEDTRAHEQGLNNTATARSLVTLLTKLARREVVSPQASDEMLDTLRAQEHNDAIPAGLPPGTSVAHKTGWNNLAYHDAAIVESEPPFVLVVLTSGFPDEPAGPTFVAEVARTVWERHHR
ncbi:MAG TPA: serine hydrolase [Fimbriimonadaceae bacterium]|nr:serine hydrolase [Fimbriimonadaceae bacterium]